MDGQTAVLACRSDSHGDVRLAWIKDGHPLRHDDHYHDDHDGSTLTLSDVTSTDAGQYVCVATRDHETVSSAAISVTVTGQLTRRIHITHQPSSYVSIYYYYEFHKVVGE